MGPNNNGKEFADHMGDDCKPRELAWEIELDPDELLAEEQAIQERRLEEDKERLERRTKAAKCLRDRAEALVAQAADMREQAELLDPAPCAGGAPRKPVVRKSRKTAVGPKKATQRRAKAAKPAKAPKAQRKGKRAEAGGSGAGNGKRGRKPAQPTADELVKALGKFGFFGGAAGMAETFGWPEHTTKRRITEAAKAGLIRNDGSRKAPQWVVV